MLPTGTANDQGKSFGLQADPDALARNVDVICAGHETRLDVGIYRALAASAEADYFFDSCGWGLSARVLARRNKDRALVETLGPLRIASCFATRCIRWRVPKTFLESFVIEDRFRVSATLDGQRVELDGLSDLIVKNTRGLRRRVGVRRSLALRRRHLRTGAVRRKAGQDVQSIRDLKVVPLNEELLEELGLEHSKTLRASSMELEIFAPERGAPLAAQLDGEEWPASSRVRIEVAKQGIRLIVPAL